ncbi:MAG: thioesterase family protein [Thermodesulfobacteriota bacterium]
MMDENNECGIWAKKDICLVPLERIEVLPLYHREIIPLEYLDAMGHMNVRWYMALFDAAIWQFFKSYGLDRDYFTKERSGVFALKHFIQYFAEVNVKETVGLRIRLLGRSDKRFQFMVFMINETTGKMASTLEVLGTHADLQSRKSSPLPPAITKKFDDQLAEDAALDWEAPLSGAIKL